MTLEETDVAGVTPTVLGGVVFFCHRVAYMAPVLLALDGIHLSQRRKRVFVQELLGLTDRTLN